MQHEYSAIINQRLVFVLIYLVYNPRKKERDDYMKINQVIGRKTIVNINRWTMEGLMAHEVVPLEDVLTVLRPFIEDENDRETFFVFLEDMSDRLFVLGGAITLDDHEYETENNEPIEDIIMSKGDFGVFIRPERFGAASYLRACGIEEEKIPAMKEKLDKVNELYRK